MKKYVIAIILIGIIIGSFMIYRTLEVQKDNIKTFDDSGYILQSSTSSVQGTNIDRYYFMKDEKYEKKYNEKVIFNDTDGEEVKTELQNFIHYSNGDISAFCNGVLLNLADLDKNPITYYNISANRKLEKNGNTYSIKNLNETLEFEQLIWKISNNKYIIISNNIQIFLEDGTNKTINGYVEIEYTDNEVVRIYNQEIIYQTISSNTYIQIGENIKLNLENKIINKDDENKMSLENMVIDSNDNVNIVDLEETKETEEAEEQQNQTEEETNQEGEQGQTTTQGTNYGTQGNQGTGSIQQGNTGTTTGGSTTTGGTQINNGTIINNGQNNIQGNEQDDIQNSQSQEDEENDSPNSTPDATIIPPKFNIERFDINPIGLEADIIIDDEEEMLVSNTEIKIVKKSTGKTVYQYTEQLGVYEISLSVATLEQNTDYILTAEASYQVEDITYTKDFIYKEFKTDTLGISIEKDMFTDTSLQIKINVNKDSNVKGATVSILNSNGEIVESKEINIKEPGRKEVVNFNKLTSNTNYTIAVTNVLYDGQVLTNGYEITEKYKTLKQNPQIIGNSYEINKRDGKFTLKLNKIVDKDKGIQKFRYEIYDTRIGNEEPIKTIESTNTQIELQIDDIDIFREVGYIFKAVAIFEDNEKIREFEGEYSEVMKMDGVAFPSVKFEEENITFERIQGTIIVEDEGNTINLTKDTLFKILYTNSIGVTKQFTSQGSYKIPVDVNNLRANETYVFEVYTEIDLQDGNGPIEECLIGKVIVKTKEPNKMKAVFKEGKIDIQKAFNVEFQLQNENKEQGTLEPETLTGLTVSIYSGQIETGTKPTTAPIKEVKLVDNNTEYYESELKEKYYDNKVIITPEFFKADNSEFKERYYTIFVTNGYDYTQYKNELPIIENSFVIGTNGYIPDLPTDTENALNVNPIRNYVSSNPRDDLDATTIVGYEVKANYNNIDLYAVKVIYKAYDQNTGKLIQTIEQPIGENGIIPSVQFEVKDGTENPIIDTDALRRGNSYYFTYEMILDLDNDGIGETHYPYDENDVLKSNGFRTEKQKPNIILYHSNSNENSMTFKYKCIDVDHSINEQKKLIIKKDNNTISEAIMNQIGEDSFNDITFNNLSSGNLRLLVEESIMKYELSEERELLSQYYEGLNTVKDLTYDIISDQTKVTIKLNDKNNQLQNVAGIRVIFEPLDGSQSVTKDLKEIKDGTVSINYNDLGQIINKSVKVNVIAYYDSGITGFDTETDKYVVYQKLQKTSDEQKFYYAINREGNLVETSVIEGKIYATQRKENNIKIQNVINGYNANIDLQYTESGFQYEGQTILQKQLEEQQLNPNGDNILKFDLIIPGISLINEAGEFNINPEINKVTLKAKLFIDNTTNIVDDKIYIDVYETNENYSLADAKKVKIEEKNINEFNNAIEIEDLTPKTYYIIKFRTEIMVNGNKQETELYDVDYFTIGKTYSFSTLADVGINEIKVEYNPVSYTQKTIDISYNLEITMGYTRIDYNIYKYNDTLGRYDKVDINIEPDYIMQNQMLKKIDVAPGSNIEFGKKYIIKIIPLLEYTDVNNENKTLELGKREQEFYLEDLLEPTVAIKGNRVDGSNISFKITVYDTHRIVKDDKYTIKILENGITDVTPEEAKIEYSTDLINNTIDIKNAKPDFKYTIIVYMQIDRQNTGTETEEISRSYDVDILNEYGISPGIVTINRNSTNQNKVDLLFNNSYNLKLVTQIRYSIYSTNGYSKNNTVAFSPQRVQQGDEVYYIFTIDETLEGYGQYYTEIQLLKDNEVVATVSAEYVYLEQ